MNEVDALMLKRLFMESPFFLSASILIIIFALPAKVDPPADHDLNVDYPFCKVNVLQGDIFAIFFSSNVKNPSANCQSLIQGGSFYLSISTVYEEPYLGKVSAVGVQLNKPRASNLIICFNADSPWNYTLGVYTRHFGFYESFWGRGISLQGYFVKYAFFSRHPGKRMIIIPLESHGSIGSPRFPLLILPTSINLIMFLAFWLLMFYVNSFAFVDTYIRSKREKVSYGRWTIIGLIIMLISIYLAYQVYVFYLSRVGDD